MKQQQRTMKKNEKKEVILVHPSWLEGMVAEGAFGLFLFFGWVWFSLVSFMCFKHQAWYVAILT